MEKNILGNTGLEISAAGFGVLTVGNTQLNLPFDKGAEVLSYAIEKGINFLDTAQAYETYPVSYTHLRAHETRHDLVCRLLLEKKKNNNRNNHNKPLATY